MKEDESNYSNVYFGRCEKSSPMAILNLSTTELQREQSSILKESSAF